MRRIKGLDSNWKFKSFDDYLAKGGIGNIKHVVAAQRSQDPDCIEPFVESPYCQSEEIYEKFVEKLTDEFKSTTRTMSVSQRWRIPKPQRAVLIAEMVDYYCAHISTLDIDEEEVYTTMFKIMRNHDFYVNTN